MVIINQTKTTGLFGDGGNTMKITVKKERENTVKIIHFTGSTVKEFLKQLKVNPETVIVVRKEEILTETELLHDKDSLDLLSVISGG